MTEKIDNTLRPQLNIWLEGYAVRWNLQGKNILEVGIGGDEKPSGSYKFFGKGNKWTTLDKNSRWKPDILADITKSGLPDNSYDIVIIVETLEHIWDYKKAISELYRITKEKLIIDCPFNYPFHIDSIRDNAQWQDWDDYFRISPAAMNKLLKDIGFKKDKIETLFNGILTLCIAEK